MAHQAHEWRRGEFSISTDADKLDMAVVHGFLTESYWARGIPREVVERSIAGSLPFGLYHGARQIGFARVISDEATFAYIGDVFVLEEYRGQGLGTWLMETVVACPDLHGLRRWTLATRDAHALYRKVGFTPLHSPERWMERWFPDVYQTNS
jgi:GNAT superfamily N-acetyltransferase